MNETLRWAWVVTILRLIVLRVVEARHRKPMIQPEPILGITSNDQSNLRRNLLVASVACLLALVLLFPFPLLPATPGFSSAGIF